MSDDKGRYRGKPVYHRVLAELIQAAQYRGLTTYQDLAVIMGLPMSGNYMGAETGWILGEIVEDEIQADRPMLSSVVVGTHGKPGPGFYTLAQDLGRFSEGDDPEDFWNKEREASYEAWCRPLPKK